MKKVLLTVLLTATFCVGKAQDLATGNQTNFYDQIPLVSNLIHYAKQHLTTRYRSGGTTPKGFDCSGFTRFCFTKFGISLPHSSAAQGNVGVAIDKESAQPGDLIFFGGHRSGESRIGHVGMITEVTENHIKFIHSAWNGGVRYDYLSAAYYASRFKGIRRVINLLTEK